MGKQLGESVLVAFADGLGAGQRIASALGAQTLTRTFKRLSLESYGKTSIPLEVVNFSDDQGTPVVSLLVVKEEPAAGLHLCVAYEVLQYINQNAPVEEATFTLFVPAAVPASKSSSEDAVAYKVAINDDEFASREQMFREMISPPDNLKLEDEFLASLLHLGRVMGFPAVFVLIPVHRVNRLDKQHICEEKASAFQAISKVGAAIAQWLALGFSNQLMNRDLPEEFITKSSRSCEWSGLYT